MFGGSLNRAIPGETPRINAKMLVQSVVAAVNRASGTCHTERVTATMTLEIITWVPDAATRAEDSGVHGACHPVYLVRQVMFGGHCSVEIVIHVLVNVVVVIAVVIGGLGRPMRK